MTQFVSASGALSVETGRKEGDIMNTINKDDPSSLDDQKPIQEQVMNRLTEMVICWSSHLTGQKTQADAIQEIRSGVAGIAEWLDELEKKGTT